MDEFGKNLLRILEEKNVSQSRLALWTDISGSAIFRYISGERSPSLSVIIRVAEALDVGVYNLVSDISDATVGDITKLNDKQICTLRTILLETGREIPEVKILRAQTGLSQKEFAEKYHQNLQSVRNWESGNLKPPEHTLYLLERNVNMDYPTRKTIEQMFD